MQGSPDEGGAPVAVKAGLAVVGCMLGVLFHHVASLDFVAVEETVENGTGVEPQHFPTFVRDRAHSVFVESKAGNLLICALIVAAFYTALKVNAFHFRHLRRVEAMRIDPVDIRAE